MAQRPEFLYPLGYSSGSGLDSPRGAVDELPVLCLNQDQRIEPENLSWLSHLPLSDCKRRFNERTGTPFNNLQFPTDIVLLVVLWRLRYKLSLRDLAEMFLVRGFEFTHETVRDWEARFAPLISEQLRARRRGQSWSVLVRRRDIYQSGRQVALLVSGH